MKTGIILFFTLLMAGGAGAADPSSRYQIHSSKGMVTDNVILLDTQTGKTWKMEPNGTWLPMTRLETEEQVKAYEAQRAKTTAAREQLRKDMTR